MLKIYKFSVELHEHNTLGCKPIQNPCKNVNLESIMTNIQLDKIHENMNSIVNKSINANQRNNRKGIPIEYT